MNIDNYYDYLVECDIVNTDTLDIITGIYGMDESVLDDVLYYKTGYRDIEQYLQYEDIHTYNLYYNN